MHAVASRWAAALAASTLLLALPTAALASPTGPSTRAAAADEGVAPPTDVRVDVVQGQPALRVSWGAPALPGSLLVTGYRVTVAGVPVADVPATDRTLTLTAGLVLGRSYAVAVSALTPGGASEPVGESQTLYVNPVTTVQAANPTNPLAGREWGMYLGVTDPAMNVWARFSQADRDRYAMIPMMSKAKYFGKWIPDSAAYSKTRDYIENAQAGDPSKVAVMTLFRMFPWEGEADVTKRLPTAAEQASYRRYVTETARAIGSDPVAVVVQPDGFFAKLAYEAHRKRGLSRAKALLPAKMLAWTAKTLAQGPNTTVYMDMGSEDWARGVVGPTAKFLKLAGVQYARGFSLNVSHKNYLDREIMYGEKVVAALAAMGLPGKHFVLDTSDNGNPFSGAELNAGKDRADYLPPGDINPCATAADLATKGKICTALGVPPTTDVDNPQWGLSPTVAAAAARNVDAYLWVSRPWLPQQGAGGTGFSKAFADRLVGAWPFSPYFTG